MPPLLELFGESPGSWRSGSRWSACSSRQADGARRLAPILILGETGTGKGLLARHPHRAGPRAAGPFVDVNCAAIPETLLEAELFGFERGAFTDARQAKAGLFQTAHRGTLFLDEVGLLPESLQAKLLKVLEERSVRRLGGTRSEPVDVWIVAATSEDLAGGDRRAAVPRGSLSPAGGGDAAAAAAPGAGRGHPAAGRALPATGVRGLRAPARTLTREARASAPRPPLAGQRAGAGQRRWSGWRCSSRGSSGGGAGAARACPRAAAPAAGARARPRSGARRGRPTRRRSGTRLLAALREARWNIARAAARLGIPRNTLRYRMEKHGLGSGTPAPRPPDPRRDHPPGRIRRAGVGAPLDARRRRRRARGHPLGVTPRDVPAGAARALPGRAGAVELGRAMASHGRQGPELRRQRGRARARPDWSRPSGSSRWRTRSSATRRLRRWRSRRSPSAPGGRTRPAPPSSSRFTRRAARVGGHGDGVAIDGGREAAEPAPCWRRWGSRPSRARWWSARRRPRSCTRRFELAPMAARARLAAGRATG